MKYKSNVDAVLGKLKEKFRPDKMDAMYLEIAQNIYRSNLRRIHMEGKDIHNKSIGKYSTNPIYVNPKKVGSRMFALKGKTGKTKFKNDKSHVSGYFKGYGAFKVQIGFSKKVNMQVTGRLKADWVLLKSRNGYVIGFASKYGKDISLGNEDHFHTHIWGVSNADRKLNTQIVKRHLNAKH